MPRASKWRRAGRGLVLAAALALGFTVFGGGDAGPVSRPASGTLRLPANEPLTLDPVHVRDTGSAEYVQEIFAGLTRIASDLSVEPDLASGWTLSANGLTYTFTIRRQASFHDGTPLTAKDVAWSWRRALDPDTGSLSGPVFLEDIEGASAYAAGEADSVSGLRVRGTRTLEVTLTAPLSFFPSKLSAGPTLVVDQRNVTATGEWWRSPNGSGPYQLLDWRPEELITLGRADTAPWRPGGPAIVEFHQLDVGEGLLLYESDELDLVSIGAANLDRFRDPNEPRSGHLLSTPDLAFQYLGFNTTLAPLDDVHVRRALALATDRPFINEVVLAGTQREARGVIPPGLPGHRPGFEGLAFDLEAAKAELEKSSYGGAHNLPPITVVASGAGLSGNPFVEVIVDPWRTELGVNVLIEVRSFDDLVTTLDEPDHDIQAFFLGWSADFPDASNFTDELFGSDRPDNSWRLSDAVVDNLIQKARVAATNAERMAYYGEIETRVIEQGVLIPLLFFVSHELVQPGVEGYAGRPMTREWLTELTIAS
ncbi:MAG: peptide ABC transporter substrate-binding protein [Chloroflexota bacterium]|nr:peptide ABC transporter substrate-binding protein [Chloroflexota bacterium]MDE2919873.1 peptide ABC transporter substrate-binding protein [Chloroflexota bacterium]